MLPAILALLAAAVPAEDNMIATRVPRDELLVRLERNNGFLRSDMMKGSITFSTQAMAR